MVYEVPLLKFYNYLRAILVDWIMEVCKEFTLKRETFHLAVHNMDRYI